MANRSSLFLLIPLIAACATTQSPPPEGPPTATVVDEPAPPANEEMQFHFWDVAEARDAVIQADLEGVRAPLLRIAEGTYGDDMPSDWRTWIEEMQTQARAGAQVKTLEEAAQAVAKLSGTCAECHRTTKAGPVLSDDAPGYQPRGEGLPERMQRHMFAAEALWAGLTAPQHQAWSRGARALSELPMPEEAGPQAEQGETEAEQEGADADEGSADAPAPLSPFVAKLDAIRALGDRADAAAQPSEKVAVYGEILTHCSSCHAQMRGR